MRKITQDKGKPNRRKRDNLKKTLVRGQDAIMRSMGIFLKLFLIAGLCCSCTSFSLDGTNAKSITLDAKKRLVLATNHGGEEHNKFAVCAEPSPDVMAGVASAYTIEGEAPAANATLALGISRNETLAQLGKRTPTIQLLRDALYRACEAYLNGLLPPEQYKELLYGYDDLVLTLLAIEGITQAPSPMTKEIANEIRLILENYYDFQKYIYENCLVAANRCNKKHDKNSTSKTTNYPQKSRNSLLPIETPIEMN